jgi:hypothetical protein
MLDRIYPGGTMMLTCVLISPGGEGRERPPGACAMVIQPPTALAGAYRLRFSDGEELEVAAAKLTVWSQDQEQAMTASAMGDEFQDLFSHVHYRCVVGSRAYGLDHAGSDIDLRGFYIAPAHMHWALSDVPEQLEYEEDDVCYWEVERFIKLALQASPNVLECLYTPLVEHCSEVAQELLDGRDMFISQMVYQTYNRYVMSQFKSMSQQRAKGVEVNPKHATHLIRLMLSGITTLKHGFVPMSMNVHRDRLLAIKRGETPWQDINVWRLELHEAFDHALEATSLPEFPDYVRANAMLLKIRRWAVSQM